MVVNGQAILSGDYIGVFYDSLGTLACAGYAVWNGSTTSIAAWGADALGGGNNGFANMEEFKWKIWSQLTNTSYNAIATYSTLGLPNTGYFVPNGMSGIASLTSISGSDLAIGNLVAPLTGCTGLSSSETISFQILNLGTTSVSSFNVSYSINGGMIITETIIASIAPNASYVFSSSLGYDFSIPGAYQVSATVTEMNDLTPANNTAILNILNYPVQQASFTMQDTLFCSSQTSQVLLTATPAGGIFTSGNIQIVGFNNQYYANFSQPGVFPISYVYTDTNNCMSIDVQSFLILSAPSLELGTMSPQCQGDTVIINPTGNYSSYEWSDGSTGSSLTITQTGNYILTVSNSAGCETIDNIAVTFLQLPQVTITGDSILCEGTSGTIQVNNTQSTFLWNDGSLLQTLAIDTAGIYSVTVTSNSTGCSNSDMVEVIEVENPPIPTGTEVSGCEGTPVTLSAGVWLAYQWSTGASTPTIQVTTAGNYSVTIYNQYLCSSSYNIGVYFNPLAIAEFSSSVTGEVATFTNLSQHEWTNSYVWDFGDGSSSTEASPVHTYAISGNFEVSLTVENDCGEDTYTSMVVITMGIGSEDEYPLFTIFPNPADDKLNFTCPASATGWMAEILDVSGRCILSQTLTSNEQVAIQLEELAAGTYILRLSNPSNEIIRRPFIKK